MSVDNCVTGASGFVGKHLLKNIKGETVTMAHGIVGTQFRPMPRAARRVFVLGAYGNMSHHTNVLEMIHANVTTVFRLAIDAQLDDCESFVFVSTSSVNLPVQTPYSRTKRAAEEILLSLPIPACIVRPYSICGVGEQKEHLIPTLIRSCLTGEQINLVLEPVHDFVDVDDITDGLLMLAGQKATGIFELGSGIGTTNEQVLAMVEDACGRKANVRVVPWMRDYDSTDWKCRAPAAGWSPKKSLWMSVKEMVESYAK